MPAPEETFCLWDQSTKPIPPATEGFIGSLAVEPHACLYQQCTHFDAIHLTKQNKNKKKNPKLLAVTAMMHLPAFRQVPLLTCFPLEHIKIGTRSRSKRELKTDHNKLPKQERGGIKKKTLLQEFKSCFHQTLSHLPSLAIDQSNG